LPCRLVWGVNDFDEACRLPYTNDLVRLATSVTMASHANSIALSPADSAANWKHFHTLKCHDA
jgi:uncharacterized protein (DUF2252 family)